MQCKTEHTVDDLRIGSSSSTESGTCNIKDNTKKTPSGFNALIACKLEQKS